MFGVVYLQMYDVVLLNGGHLCIVLELGHLVRVLE
jgi:hypothetical protein